MSELQPLLLIATFSHCPVAAYFYVFYFNVLHYAWKCRRCLQRLVNPTPSNDLEMTQDQGSKLRNLPYQFQVSQLSVVWNLRITQESSSPASSCFVIYTCTRMK